MEFAREALRLRMLNATHSVDPAVIDRFFMDGAVHAHLHQLWTQVLGLMSSHSLKTDLQVR